MSSSPTSSRDAHAPIGGGSSPDEVDIAVIGAGVNGLAIARDAAARGLRVAVLERADIGSGASSASSRLIHGGLKYLEHLELGLVLECIRERHLLFRTAPHLVRDYPMLIPFYEGNRRPAPLVRLGLAAFDLLALGRGRGYTRHLGRSQVRRRWPSLATTGLRGAALYHDAQIPWPERLCVELMLDAESLGATVHTYTAVTGLLRDGKRVVGVRAHNVFSGEVFELRAGLTINAAGPWIDRVLHGHIDTPRLNGGTKGSHVLVDSFPGAPDTSVFFEAMSDHRPIFVLPWDDRYWLGSTDLTYEGDLDQVRADPAEVDYLLTETNRIFPMANLSRRDVRQTISGVRPLPYVGPVSDNSQITRRHKVHSHAPQHPGLVTIIGGKLSTHRSLAEEAVDKALRLLGQRSRRTVTRRRPFPGARTGSWPGFRAEFLARSPLPGQLSNRLLDVYGTRAQRVLDLVETSDDTGAASDWDARVFRAEVTLAVTEEKARTLADVLLRRASHRLGSDLGRQLAAEAASVMASLLGWDDERTRREVEAYHREIARYQPPSDAPRREHQEDVV